MKRHKSADLKKVDQKIQRGSYIDDIEKFEAKHKPPGVGKFDITKDPWKKTFSPLKAKEKPEKPSNMDDIKFLGAGVVGPGHYNPHVKLTTILRNLSRN